jgi:SAM-dependent methyltransferase
MESGRDRLKRTFESAADLYHLARPDYPVALFDTLADLTRLRPGAELLEVGCATGKATLPLARRGYKITCVELGGRLAAKARANLAGYPNVEVIEHDFETWQPAERDRFDLVFAATAWHWIDPASGFPHAWELLKPTGHLALWNAMHVLPPGGDPIFGELQEIYDEIGERLPADYVPPTPSHMPDHRAEIEASGLFTNVVTRPFDWESRYTAQAYIDLLDTFSGHIAMPQASRDRLYGAIRQRLAERPDGQLRRHWGAVLSVASRRAASR